MMTPSPATGRLNDAMISAVRSHVFGRPLGSPWVGMEKAAQGRAGAQGGPAGSINGYIGAAIPQSGPQPQKSKSAAPAQQPAQPAMPQSPGGGQSGGFGLEHILPLLGFLLPMILRGMGGGQSGGGGGAFGIGSGFTPQSGRNL